MACLCFLYFSPHAVVQRRIGCYNTAGLYDPLNTGRPETETVKDMNKKKGHIWFLVVNILLLLLVIAVTGALIVRSDWRYGLFDRFRSRNPVKKTVLVMNVEDCRVIAVEDILKGMAEGVRTDQSLLLVNDEHRLDNAYQPAVVEFRQTDLYMDPAVVQPLEELLAANTQVTGEKLLLVSAYRTAEEQAQVLKEETGVAAQVGASEHQTGLGLDICVSGKAQRRFIDSETGVWVDRNAWQYGFIIRYPLLKKRVTGQGYEPWHIRYVGKPHAELIYRNRLTLEEYLDSLEVDGFFSYDGYGFSLQQPDENGALRIPAAWRKVVVSPDNTGQYMITGLLPHSKVNL